MSNRTKLAVIDTIADAFNYSFKKLPSLVVLYLSTTILIFGPILWLAYPLVIDFFQFFTEVGENVDPEEFAEQIIPFAPIIGLLVLGSLLQYVVITSLIIRNISHGETLWLIRINKNTFRYIVAAIVVSLLMVVVYAGFAAIIAGAVISAGENQEMLGPVVALSVLAGLFVFVYFLVRLSLIPIDVVAQSNFAIGRGFRVSRGNVLRLIGLGVIVFAAILAIAMIAQIVISILLLAGGLAFFPSDLDAVEQDPSLLIGHLMALLTSPIMVIVIVFSVILDAFQTGVMTSAPVFAYRRLLERDLP